MTSLIISSFSLTSMSALTCESAIFFSSLHSCVKERKRISASASFCSANAARSDSASCSASSEARCSARRAISSSLATSCFLTTLSSRSTAFNRMPSTSGATSSSALSSSASTATSSAGFAGDVFARGFDTVFGKGADDGAFASTICSTGATIVGSLYSTTSLFAIGAFVDVNAGEEATPPLPLGVFFCTPKASSALASSSFAASFARSAIVSASARTSIAFNSLYASEALALSVVVKAETSNVENVDDQSPQPVVAPAVAAVDDGESPFTSANVEIFVTVAAVGATADDDA
mmetsp:Transcript_4081/g.13640  ORF Transcript_4081/g.13640 Transcript_4081/m.13640 type:complete len:292 (+) Transcript_4081:1574-2449(+)